MDSAALHFDSSLCGFRDEAEITTGEPSMSSCDSHNSPCFAARAVTWLRHRHQNWPAKAVAREIGEAVPTVESWWAGKALPSTRKLAALFTRYPAMVPFVMQPWLDQDFLRAQRKLEEARKIIDEVMTWEAKR